MPTTGHHAPNTAANVARSGSFSTSPNWSAEPSGTLIEAIEDAGSTWAASATHTVTGYTNYLFASNYTLGVPDGATIDGVIVYVNRWRDEIASNISTSNIHLRSGGAGIGTAKSSALIWSTSAQTQTFGSSTDTWGAALTAAIVNSSSFGVAVSMGQTNSTANGGNVNYITIEVYYTPAPITLAGTSAGVATATGALTVIEGAGPTALSGTAAGVATVTGTLSVLSASGSEGPNSPANGASVARAGSAAAWTSPGNIVASDDARSIYSSTGGYSDWLTATGFGFSLPDGADITGVTVSVERVASAVSRISTSLIELHDNSVTLGTGKVSGTTWGTTEASQAFGGASDAWGASLTSAIVNSSTFGVRLSAATSAGTLINAGVDHITVTIEYVETTTTPVALDGSAAGTATVTGELSIVGIVALDGSAAGVATATGELSGIVIELDGIAEAFATATGILRVEGPEPAFLVAPPLPVAPAFRLAIFAPLTSGRTERLDVVGIDADVVSLVWRLILPGGFGELQVGLARTLETITGERLRYSRLPVHVHTRPFNHVQLWANSALVFEGRMAIDSALSDQFTVHGYWKSLGDSHYESTSVTPTSTGEVLKHMLVNVASVIRVAGGDNFQDPLVNHTDADADGMTTLGFLDQVVMEGSSQGVYMDWAVWERRELWLQQRAAPVQPDYRLSYDTSRMQWLRDPDELRSAVKVQYTAFDQGVASITAAATSITVAHSLGFAPDEESFRITPLTELGAATAYHIDSITSASFVIRLTAPRAASGTTLMSSGNTWVTVAHDLGVLPTADELSVTPLSQMGGGAGFYVDNITSTTFRINMFQEERGNGTATITSAATSVAVTHGMSRTPTAEEITWTPTNGPTNDPGNVWVSAIGATTFTLNCRNAPGASTATFNWAVRFQNVPQPADPGAAGASFAWEIVMRDSKVAQAPGVTVQFAWAIEASDARTSWAESNTFIDRWGIQIREIIPAGLLTTAAAQRVRDTILAESQDVKHAISIEWPFAEPLPGPQGQPRPPWAVRTGQWLQVADSPLLPLINVEVDANAKIVRIEAGSRIPTYQVVMEQLQRDIEKWRSGANAVTGGRL